MNASFTFDEFRNTVSVSLEEICRDFYNENRDRLKIKKERVVVKNLMNIMDAILALASEKGFDAMSLRDLSARTGLSMGGLYSYFSGKDELLALVHTQGQRTVGRILTQVLDGDAGARERLRTFIRGHLYLSEMMQPWFYFFFMETKNLDPKHRKIPIESELLTEQLCVDIIDAGAAQGVFRPVEPVLAAAGVKALLQDWYLKRWKYTRRKVTVDAYAAFVIEMTEAYLGAAEPAGKTKRR